jgi:hypothetical protein
MTNRSPCIVATMCCCLLAGATQPRPGARGCCGVTIQHLMTVGDRGKSGYSPSSRIVAGVSTTSGILWCGSVMSA